jgi:hypothetical protein
MVRRRTCSCVLLYTSFTTALLSTCHFLIQTDLHRLDKEGKFIVNGLSDVRKGLKGETTQKSATETAQANQGFDVKYDRSVCPIPWWRDSMALSDEEVRTSGESQCTTSEYSSSQDETTLRSIQVKLQRLRLDLGTILDKPTMLDSRLGHVSILPPFLRMLSPDIYVYPFIT